MYIKCTMLYLCSCSTRTCVYCTCVCLYIILFLLLLLTQLCLYSVVLRIKLYSTVQLQHTFYVLSFLLLFCCVFMFMMWSNLVVSFFTSRGVNFVLFHIVNTFYMPSTSALPYNIYFQCSVRTYIFSTALRRITFVSNNPHTLLKTLYIHYLPIYNILLFFYKANILFTQGIILICVSKKAATAKSLCVCMYGPVYV